MLSNESTFVKCDFSLMRLLNASVSSIRFPQSLSLGRGQKPSPLESKDFSDSVKSWLDKLITKLSLPFSLFLEALSCI